MATKTTTFIAMIAREGSSGSVRGKIPAGLVKAINAKEGDGVEFKVHGTTLVGAQVLSGRALRDALKEKAAEAPAPRAKAAVKKVAPKVAPKAVKRSVGKVAKTTAEPPAVRRVGKKPKPVVKASKRRTEVEYEAPKVVRKVGKFSGKLKRKN